MISSIYERRITDVRYDGYYQSFREKVAEVDTKLGMLQEAEDNYYITSKYLLKLSNRAHELFVSSEVAEKRQLVKLVLSNLRLEGEKLRYEAVKPFDLILNCSDNLLWLPLVDMFSNREVEFGFSLQNIQTVFECMNLNTRLAFVD